MPPPEVPCIEEQSDAYGIISISYRGLPIGPTIGKRYDYRLLVAVFNLMGEWHLERYPDWSASVLTVGPPHADPKVFLGGVDAMIANFDFISPTGANDAIIQVASDPNRTFTPPEIYTQIIPGDWTGTELPPLNSMQVDLSQVPGTGGVYFWRIGARNTDNFVAPRPYPLSRSLDYGYVWGERMCFRYEVGQFSDVPTLHWAFGAAEACYQAGIVFGFPDGSYGPDLAVTRGQMAIYVARALAGGDEGVPDGPPIPTFPDVPTSDICYKYIEYAVANQIVFGYQDDWYWPGYEVDRGTMAVFVARAIATPIGEPGMVGYVPPPTPTFTDVTPDPLDPYQVCYKYVEYIADAGVTQGYPDGLYHPEYVVTRGLMAIYVARAFGLL